MRALHLLRAVVLMTLGFGTILLAGGASAWRDPAFWTLAACMMAWNVAEVFVLRRPEPSDYAAKRNTRLLQGAVLVGGIVSALDRWRLHWSGLPGWALPAGAAVILVGAALRLWSIRTLDAHFTYELRVEQGQRIVDRGPYRLVRHPSYLGLLVITLGEGLALGSPLGLAVGALAVMVVLVMRIGVEERVLRDSFGSAYDEYARGTWRLVPFVY